MRRRALIVVGVAILIAGGFAGLTAWQNAKAPDTHTELLQGQKAKLAEIFEGERKRRAACETETEGWRYRECMEKPHGNRYSPISSLLMAREAGLHPSVITRADDGDPEAALEYGYYLVAQAIVNETDPEAAIPYLMTAALAGDIGAHVQLGLIEAVTKDEGDLVRARAHFDVALRDMDESAPDYRRSQMHFDDIDAGLSDAERDAATALAAEYAETMRAKRNALK